MFDFSLICQQACRMLENRVLRILGELLALTGQNNYQVKSGDGSTVARGFK